MTTTIQLDEFTQAYIEAALWSSNDDSTPEGGEPLDANYGIEDIDPDSLAKMSADCQRFQEENAADLALYDSPRWTAEELGGHDFWLTRNGHGAGFWDRDCLPKEAGKRLTDAAHKCGEVYLYVADGAIYMG
jgi:hypothetical protein